MVSDLYPRNGQWYRKWKPHWSIWNIELNFQLLPMATPVLKIWFASIPEHSGSVINACGMLVEFAFPDSSIVKEKLKEATSHCRLTSEHFALYSLGQLLVQYHLQYQYHCCHYSACQNLHES